MPPRSSAMRSFFHICARSACSGLINFSSSTAGAAHYIVHEVPVDCAIRMTVKSQPEEPRTAWTSQIPCQRTCPDPYHGRQSSIHSCPSVPAHPLHTWTLHCSFPQRVSNLLGPSPYPSKAAVAVEDSTSAPVSHFPRHSADPLQAAAESRCSLCSSKLGTDCPCRTPSSWCW